MIDKNKCMACLSCVLGCMAEHTQKMENLFMILILNDTSNESRNHIELNESLSPAPIIWPPLQ